MLMTSMALFLLIDRKRNFPWKSHEIFPHSPMYILNWSSQSMNFKMFYAEMQSRGKNPNETTTTIKKIKSYPMK